MKSSKFLSAFDVMNKTLYLTTKRALLNNFVQSPSFQHIDYFRALYCHRYQTMQMTSAGPWWRSASVILWSLCCCRCREYFIADLYDFEKTGTTGIQVPESEICRYRQLIGAAKRYRSPTETIYCHNSKEETTCRHTVTTFFFKFKSVY